MATRNSRTSGRSNPRSRYFDDEDPMGDGRDDDRRWTDLARKLVRGGAEVLITTQDAVRERAGDIKAKELPKEFVESVAHLTARTKDELVGLMAREFKNYLDKLDLATEVREILEQYTLDVNMSIRLRPNEAFDRREGPEEELEEEPEEGEAEEAEEGEEEEGEE